MLINYSNAIYKNFKTVADVCYYICHFFLFLFFAKILFFKKEKEKMEGKAEEEEGEMKLSAVFFQFVSFLQVYKQYTKTYRFVCVRGVCFWEVLFVLSFLW